MFNLLIERLKAASQRDGRLNAEIDCAIRFPLLRPAEPDDHKEHQQGLPPSPSDIWTPTGFLMAQDYTGSIDDAMRLVPRGWRVALLEWDHETLRAKGPWQCILTPAGHGDSIDTSMITRCDHAPTSAIAICIAALKAWELSAGDENPEEATSVQETDATAPPTTKKPGPKITIIGRISELATEDSGQAKIGELEPEIEVGSDACLFVRLQSWRAAKLPDGRTPNPALSEGHPILQSLEGQRLKVTISVIDEQPSSENEALKLGTHRHYKGGIYRILGEGRHTETGEALVLYEHLWPHERSFHARPREMFFGHLPDGQPRFQLLRNAPCVTANA